MDLPGIRFQAVSFTPHAPGDGKYGDTPLRGIRFVVADRAVYDPVHAALAALIAIRDTHSSFAFRPAGFDRLAGTDRLRLAIESGARAGPIVSGWSEALASFERLRAPYLLYR